MRSTAESFHRHERSGSRVSGRNGRQEWVPRGSVVVSTPSTASTIPNGNRAESNARRNHAPVPDNRQRPNFGRSNYVARPSAQKRESEDLESKGSNVPQLVQEIQEKLAKGTVDCMICYDMVRRTAPIWSCSSCYSIFHLNCIKKWAEAPTSIDLSAEKDQGLNWRCPGCQSVQLVASKDIRYTCFCGRRPDPPTDFYLTPHSCGEPCGRPLEKELRGRTDGDENRCNHVCVLQCHPGPCPPCKALAPPRLCPCGKKTITRRCSDRKSVVTCGQPCGKVLECGRHRCERICHLGDCDPCGVLVNAMCFCKKKTEVVLCGEMSVKGEVEESDGLFSCNSVCGKTLSCRHHYCSKSCHPGPCGECQLLPSKIKTCYCGKTPLQGLRQSCLDLVPTCSQVCGKALRCMIHSCKEICHVGDCAPCLVLVSQKCRCGSSSRTVECYRTLDDKDHFMCEKPCGRKKNCGRHRCNERCCPLSSSTNRFSDDWDPHLCSIVCAKKLRCGQHSCQSLCHSGHCPPCLETIFTDLSCACGKTVIPPPLPCGTPPPSCQSPCSVPQACGHLGTHSCHFGDCPPCSVPVAKECIGGHVVLRNIPCGSRDIRCNQLCGKTRQCGMHACARTCHPPPCDSSCGSGSSSGLKTSCGQICGAPRRDCRHTCTATCHPSAPCPDRRCDFPVTITCSCGRMAASVPCDAGGSTSGFNVDPLFEASIIQKLPAPLQPVEANGKRMPFGQRKLLCDEECAKIERKRVLAEAFDITPPNLDALHFGDNSIVSDLLADLFRREPKWVLAVEERFKFLVLGKSKGGAANGMRVHVFSAMPKEKRDAIRQIAERWKLSIQAAGWEPRRFLVVHVTLKSKVPARFLGSKGAGPVSVCQTPVFDPLVDMDPRLVVAFLDLPRDADISALVLRFGGECELVWLNDKNALAIFGDPARAATALRRLDHGSTYHGAVAVSLNVGGSGSSLSGSSAGNAWGAKDGGSVVKSNPWKKAVVQDSGWTQAWGGDCPNNSGGPHAQMPAWKGKEAAPDRWKKAVVQDSGWTEVWGGDCPNNSGGPHAQMPAWKGKEAAPVSAASKNRWNILDPESVENSKVANVVEVQDLDHPTEGSSLVREPRVQSSTSVGLAGAAAAQPEEVDDWEKAYE